MDLLQFFHWLPLKHSRWIAVFSWYGESVLYFVKSIFHQKNINNPPSKVQSDGVRLSFHFVCIKRVFYVFISYTLLWLYKVDEKKASKREWENIPRPVNPIWISYFVFIYFYVLVRRLHEKETRTTWISSRLELRKARSHLKSIWCCASFVERERFFWCGGHISVLRTMFIMMLLSVVQQAEAINICLL